MQIYLPDCPFEVSSTNRYTITTHEASIVARRFIKRNETIKYLSGIQVLITPEEEAALSDRKKDFSIVVSSRSRMSSLFMGPARFANHDCGANAKLVITSQATIDIVAVRHIEVGEEITVTYGDNYFGDGNCECLCQTCENNLANGWEQPDGFLPVKKSIEGDTAGLQGYNTRGRRRSGRGESRSRTPSVTPDVRPKVPRTKAQRLQDPERASTNESSVEEPSGAPKRKRDTESLATPPVTPAKRQKMAQYKIVPSPLQKERSVSSDAESGGITSRSESSAGEAALTNITTPEETTDPVDVTVRSMDLSQLVNNFKQEQEPEESASKGLREVAPFQGSLDLETPRPPERAGLSIRDLINTPSVTSSPNATRTPIDRFAAAFGAENKTVGTPAIEVQPTEASESSATEDDDLEGAELVKANAEPVLSAKPSRASLRKRSVSKASTRDETLVASLMEVEENRLPTPPTGPPNRRQPGDYELTPRLLSEPDMAWVRCTNCSTAFVQQNAYYTRASCPRCERHSKLYGYVWPKTQQNGPGDKEERILDHRTIHRFLALGDELVARGRAPIKRPNTSTPGRDDSRHSFGRGKYRFLQNGRAGSTPGLDAQSADLSVRRSGRVRTASMKAVGAD